MEKVNLTDILQEKTVEDRIQLRSRCDSGTGGEDVTVPGGTHPRADVLAEEYRGRYLWDELDKAKARIADLEEQLEATEQRLAREISDHADTEQKHQDALTAYQAKIEDLRRETLRTSLLQKELDGERAANEELHERLRQADRLLATYQDREGVSRSDNYRRSACLKW